VPRGIDGGGAGGRGLTGGRGTGLCGGRAKVSLGRLPPVVHPVHAGKAVPVQQVRIQRLFLKVVFNLPNKIPPRKDMYSREGKRFLGEFFEAFSNVLFRPVARTFKWQ
jgi:hypothetical protein